jgi:hypothetical protein
MPPMFALDLVRRARVGPRSIVATLSTLNSMEKLTAWQNSGAAVHGKSTHHCNVASLASCLYNVIDAYPCSFLQMGFEGTSVTPQIRKLITEHHLGSILLTAKNLKSEMTRSSHRLSIHH